MILGTRPLCSEFCQSVEKGVYIYMLRADTPVWASLSYFCSQPLPFFGYLSESPQFSWPLWNLAPYGTMCWRTLPAECSSIYDPQGRLKEGERKGTEAHGREVSLPKVT